MTSGYWAEKLWLSVRVRTNHLYIGNKQESYPRLFFLLFYFKKIKNKWNLFCFLT